MAEKVETWGDFKKLLDNPDLPDDVKVHLLEAAGSDDYAEYYLSDYSDDEMNDLKKKYHVSDNQVDNYSDADGKSFNDVVSDAQQSATDDAAHNKKVKDSKDKLADITSSAGKGDFGGAGAKNSNDILDQGVPALKYFSDFLPLYAKVSSSFRGGDQAQAVKDMDEVNRRYDEQRDIPFDKFVDESTKLGKAADSARTASSDMGTQLSTLFQDWTGDASKGAQKTYTTFNNDTNDNVVGKLQSVSDAVAKTQAGVAQAVTKKATSTLDILHASDPNYSNGMLGGKSVDEWSTTIDIANGSEDQTTLRKAAEAWDVDISEQSCSSSLTDETKEAIRKKAQEVTSNILVKNVSDDWSDFMKMCDDTRDSVNKLWTTLTDKVKDVPAQPYSDAKKPDGDKPDPKDDPDKDNKKSPPPDPKGAQDSPPPGGQDGSQPPPVNAPPDPSGGGNQQPDLSKVGDQIPGPQGGDSPPPGGDSPQGDPGADSPQGGGGPTGGGSPPPTPDLSSIGAPPPSGGGAPPSGGGDPTGGGGDPTGGGSPPPTPDLSNIGAPPPSGGGAPPSGGGGGDPTGGGSPPPTPDLSKIGGDTPGPDSSTDPSSMIPDPPTPGGGSGGGTPPGGSGGGGAPQPPPPPDLSGIGGNIPSPSDGGPGGGKGGPGGGPQLPDLPGTGPNGLPDDVVKQVKLPGGGTATIGKPDANGNELLTVHEPGGQVKKYELDFGKPGDAPHVPGATTIRPDAQGQMVIHDGDKTLTVGKPDDNGVSQVTVKGPDGAEHKYHLVPPDTDLDKLRDETMSQLDGLDTNPASSSGDLSIPDLSVPDPSMPDLGGGSSPDLASVLGGDGGTAPTSSGGVPGAPAMDAAPVDMAADSTPLQQAPSSSAVGAQGQAGATPAGAAGAAPGGPGGAPGGGMGMMPPGGGAQGGKGGDTERKSNKWGMTGNLFDDLSTQRADRLQNFLEGRPRDKQD